jgi:cbb3-type cytochrome oxidase maturation protein
MSLTAAGLAIAAVAVLGAALSLGAFLWAVRTGQFTPKQMDEGATAIFDGSGEQAEEEGVTGSSGERGRP